MININSNEWLNINENDNEILMTMKASNSNDDE